MSICSSGVSAPKAGVSTSIVVDERYIKSILPPAISWLYPYLPGMGALAIGDVPAFCVADPPTFSVPSVTDLYNYLAGNQLSSYNVVKLFLDNITKAYLWYQLCECTTVSTPSAPSPPSAPSGLPAVNPAPFVGPAPAQTCGTFGTEVVDISDNLTHYLYGTFTNGTTPLSVPPSIYKALPANTTAVRITLTAQTLSGTADGAHVSVGFVNALHTAVSVGGLSDIAADTTVVFDQANLDATKVQVYVLVQKAHTFTSTIRCTVTLDFYCGGVPPTSVQSNCACPPDPVILAQLHQILDLVTLLQRQAVPFAYVSSTVHTGLSGAGNFDVQGLLGVLVNVTTTPTPIGREGTSPTEYFNMGWLTFGTADGYPSSYRLERSDQVLTPARCSLYTNFAYDLHPGVVITVTELLREP